MVATPDTCRYDQVSRETDPWFGHAWDTLLNSSVHPARTFCF